MEIRSKHIKISLVLVFLIVMLRYPMEIYAEENSGYREVSHVTFSGVPDAESGIPGTGKDGDVWDGTYYHDKNGNLMTDVFFSDGVYTYYLQFDGTPMKSRLTYHPDGQHIIYFDKDGHEVFDNAVRVKRDISGNLVNDICYFGTYGYMYKNELTFANIDPPFYNSESWGSVPCYFNVNGVLQTNGWFEFSDGNYGYAKYGGELINNQFGYDPYGRVVFYHWNGQVAKGLIADDNYYYSMSEEDGHLLGMWRKDDPEHISMKEDTSDIDNNLYDMSIQGDNVITREVTDHSILNLNGRWSGNNADFLVFKTTSRSINTLDGSDDLFITNRGISLGASKEEVLKKYHFDGFMSTADNQLLAGYDADKMGYGNSVYKEQIDECIGQIKSYSFVGWVEREPSLKNKINYSYLYNPLIWYKITFYYDDNDKIVMMRFSVDKPALTDMNEQYEEEIIE